MACDDNVWLMLSMVLRHCWRGIADPFLSLPFSLPLFVARDMS
jgi:hypothetical protein